MSAGACSVPILKSFFANTCDATKTEAEKAGKGNFFDIVYQMATSPAPKHKPAEKGTISDPNQWRGSGPK